jgi:uncharacterized protein (TIRG00374 family)
VISAVVEKSGRDEEPIGMRFGRAVFGLALLAAAYLAVLIYMDQRNRLFDHLLEVGTFVPVLVLVSLVAFSLRYLRWKWLLGRHGFEMPWLAGLLSYLAGFALTVSPGRVGELIRIRYFARLSVPAEPVVACFIFERSCDLIVILLLASLIGTAWLALWQAALFVAVAMALVAAVVAISVKTSLWRRIAAWLRRGGWKRMARPVRVFGAGIARTTMFLHPVDLVGAFSAGLAIWGLQASGFVYLTTGLGLALPLGGALATYPLAALIGTASMLPGGIGSTETAATVILTQLGAPLHTAVLAVVAMRLCTHWLAILLGLLSAAFLEFVRREAIV